MIIQIYKLFDTYKLYYVNQMSFNAKVIEKFSSSVLDNDSNLSLIEMKKILGEIYKDVKNDTDDISSKKRRRSSKKNDSDKPKKPPSAYNIFIKEKMQELKETDASIPPKQLMKVASTYWNKLSEDEKKSFKDIQG